MIIYLNVKVIIVMTLNYIGSKKTLLPFLDHVIMKNIDYHKNSTFGDLFAGTGIVGDYFSKKGFVVTGNDTEQYSYVINRATLKSTFNDKLKNLLVELNNLDGVDGLMYKNYSPYANRLFFTVENARKADAIRIKISELKKDRLINSNEYYFLLASLIQSLDKVANTTSVYGAFLKKFKKSALKPLVVAPIHTTTVQKNKNKVLRKNILDIKSKFNVVYLDPPYVARQYGANYCPLNYLIEYDENITLRGKTGLYDYYKSPFASKANAQSAFEELFQVITTKSNNIFLSYNNDGILSLEEMVNIMKEYGEVTTYKFSYKKFQATKSNGGNTEEYLHYLKCSDQRGKTRQVQIIKDHSDNITEQ